MAAIIQCDRLTKSYGRITALKEISLAVQCGVVGLLGPNGAGKSTLLSVLLGQVPATSGEASVLGLDIRRRQRDIRRRIGFVPENDCLIPGMSGVGYVYYTGRLSGMTHGHAMQRTHEILDYVGLDEARYRPAEQYSTGMRQSLKLGQALVHDPDLVLLDEPTNGMDPQGREMMLTLIGDLGRAGVSVLLSSHLLPDVERLCERVIIMGGGEILTEGRIADMNRPHPTLYGVEFSGQGEEFRRRLTSHQVRVLEQVDGKLQIELPQEGAQDVVLQSARDSGVRVFGLRPKRSSLEETFMAAIGKQQRP